MSRDEDKLIRQLSLLSFLLSRPRPFTAREVQESVEGYSDMSDETFARRFYADRSDLAKIGVEIQVLEGADTGAGDDARLYYLPAGEFRLPEIDLSPAERRALCLALATLDGRFAYARPLRLALMSLLRGEYDPLSIELERLPVALAPDEDARQAGKQLSRLEDAINRGKTVSFSYPTADGDLLERTLDPYNLFLIQGHWYVVGRDHLRDAIRTFRLGRIKGAVRFLSEKSGDFSIPSDYDPAMYGARPPWLIGTVRGEAVIRVGEDMAWRVKRLEPHVRWLADEDGCARFAVPFADELLLLAWVAGLGGCAEVLEPATTRRRFADLLGVVAQTHAEPPPGQAFPPIAPPNGSDVSRDRRRRRGERAAGPVAAEHLARTLALLYYLVDERRPPLVSWRSLEDDLGLTRDEVEADLSLINLVNFGGGTYALMAEAGPEGVHVVRDVMADTFAQPARLSPVMARALLLALDLLGDTVALDGLESLASVREKVRTLVGSDISERAVVVDDVLSPDPAIVEALNHAIRDRELVALEYYTASRHELSERLVEPYLLFHSPAGWYLEAYCLKAGGQRTFKLDNIRTARSTGAGFIPRPEVDLTRRRSGEDLLPGEGAHRALVRFHPRWRAYLEEQGMECILLPRDEVQVRMPYLDERWLAQEILRYLGEALLEQPASARQRIRDLALALAARYEGSGTAGSPVAREGDDR